jgi:hypothetical protein
MINPDRERFMAKRAQSQVIELPGSHAIFLSHAREVAALIERAAKAVGHRFPMSAFGTKRTCQHVCALSALRGKADLAKEAG